MKQHLLFVCTANQQRSPTAADLFVGSPHYEATSCGVHPWAATRVNRYLLDWADYIICMEEAHKQAILEEFPETEPKKFLVLEIPDAFERGDPDLIRTLVEKMPDFF